MNQTLEVIKSRRSTRKFQPEQLKEEELQAVIEAGLYAPSAHNQQPWYFTVIQNQEFLHELNQKTKEVAKGIQNDFLQKIANNEKFNIFYEAPTVIVISGQESAISAKVDCAAATENMLLAAESLDLGSCWVGLLGVLLNNEQGADYRAKLNIPEGYHPYYAVALGYKGVRGTKAPARKENTVHYIK